MSGSNPITNTNKDQHSGNPTGAKTGFFITIRSTGEKVSVSEEVFKAYAIDIHNIRQKEQRHHRCICPMDQYSKCDGDCLTCPYHREGDTVSYDVPGEDEDGPTWGESFADTCPETEKVVEARELLQQVIEKLRELDPEADLMIALWYGKEKISDREMARRLGRNEDSFCKQIRRYRKILKNIF